MNNKELERLAYRKGYQAGWQAGKHGKADHRTRTELTEARNKWVAGWRAKHQPEIDALKFETKDFTESYVEDVRKGEGFNGRPLSNIKQSASRNMPPEYYRFD